MSIYVYIYIRLNITNYKNIIHITKRGIKFKWTEAGNVFGPNVSLKSHHKNGG